MPTRTCPQCRKVRSDIAFEHPIRTCLFCYSALPWNQDLEKALFSGEEGLAKVAIQELRARAHISGYSKKMERKRRIREAEPHMIADDGQWAGRSEVGAISKSLDNSMLHCDGCQREFDMNVLTEIDTMPSEEKALVCNKCLDNPEMLDKSCCVCQKRFPLIAMHMYDTKLYCEVCIPIGRATGVDKIRLTLARRKELEEKGESE